MTYTPIPEWKGSRRRTGTGWPTGYHVRLQKELRTYWKNKQEKLAKEETNES